MDYFDCDGVLLNTEVLLFEEWRKNPDRFSLPESVKIKYIQNSDWRSIVYNAEIIQDSLYYLKQMDPNTSAILTKVHSINNEGRFKIQRFRDEGIKQPVILVPYTCKKTDIVLAKGNRLVDDCLRNLDDWEEAGGEPLFFDINDDDYDSWDKPNTKGYQKVKNIGELIR